MRKNFIISAFILFILTLLAGCSVGIRPAYYDLPPIDENQNYYGEPAYNQYYVSPPSGYKYDYDSTYDPWTMGNYYDYTPPQRVSRESQTSTDSNDNSASIGDRRPTIRDRSTSSDQSSMAPKRDNTSLRRERIIKQENANKSSDSNTSSETHKSRRELNRNDSQSGNSDSQQSKTNDKEDEEKQKQKRKRGVSN